MKNELALYIARGLKRKSITRCSDWAQQYRIMGAPFEGPFGFTYHPWLFEMHNCTDEMIVGQKAAQMGYSEAAMNKVFYSMDIKKHSALYVFPSDKGVGDFSKGRFDGVLELSPHIGGMYTGTKNVGLKRCGVASLYLRGSNSREGLKSIPAPLCILDEVEEMNQDNIALIPERMAGQLEKQMFLLSTPSHPGYGINGYFLDSTQDHFFFKCPHCGKFIELTWEENVHIIGESVADPRIHESYYFCHLCQGKLPHESKREWLTLENTEWVSAFPSANSRGFHVNQMYSPTMTPAGMVAKFLKGKTNESEEVDFWNSKLGLPFAAKGAKVDMDHIQQCIRAYSRNDPLAKGVLTTMGVDVGKVLHYEIDQWAFPPETKTRDINLNAQCKVVRMGEAQSFDEVSQLMYEYNIDQCVIDMKPEIRLSKEFAQRHYGKVKRCDYVEGRGVDLMLKPDLNEAIVAVNRSAWLDLSLGRFRREGQMLLPQDTPQDYKDMIMALTKTYKKDQWGKLVARYIKNERDADHYAHARNYSEMALRVGLAVLSNKDVTGVI